MTVDQFKMMISGAVLAFFVFMYVYLLYLSWRGKPLPTFKTQFIFVANSLAATVGTIVATSFGQQLPPTPGGGPAPAVVAEQPAADASVPAMALKNAVVIETDSNWRKVMPSIYIISYFVMGSAAIVTWLFRDPPEMVNTLAYITFGLMLNIVRVAF